MQALPEIWRRLKGGSKNEPPEAGSSVGFLPGNAIAIIKGVIPHTTLGMVSPDSRGSGDSAVKIPPAK